MNDSSMLGQGSEEKVGGLAWPPGLEAVRDQLAARIAVLQAERARLDAESSITAVHGTVRADFGGHRSTGFTCQLWHGP